MADANRWYADVGADSTVTARSFRDSPEKLESMSKTQPSSEPLKQVVDGDFRKQLVFIGASV